MTSSKAGPDPEIVAFRLICMRSHVSDDRLAVIGEDIVEIMSDRKASFCPECRGKIAGFALFAKGRLGLNDHPYIAVVCSRDLQDWQNQSGNAGRRQTVDGAEIERFMRKLRAPFRSRF